MSVLSPNTQLDAKAVRIELLRQAPPWRKLEAWLICWRGSAYLDAIATILILEGTTGDHWRYWAAHKKPLATAGKLTRPMA